MIKPPLEVSTFGIFHFSPHLCVGFFFWFCTPVLLCPPSSVRLLLVVPTHTLLTHKLSTHNLLTHNLLIHTPQLHTVAKNCHCELWCVMYRTCKKHTTHRWKDQNMYIYIYIICLLISIYSFIYLFIDIYLFIYPFIFQSQQKLNVYIYIYIISQ